MRGSMSLPDPVDCSGAAPDVRCDDGKALSVVPNQGLDLVNQPA